MNLSFEDVTFRYRRRLPTVLANFTWSVPPGRTVLLGPNGAGKSTALALAVGALSPQRGRVVMAPPHERHGKGETVGWMPQATKAIPGFRCLEQVAYAGWLKGLSKRTAIEAAEEALALVNLRKKAAVRASELSGGQLRRLGLAQVLVHSPRILLLDEPTVGLDPAQRSRLRELLFEATQRLGSQVVVSTHQVDDLSDSYDQVAVMDAGEIVFQGSVARFLATVDDMPNPAARAELAYSRFVRED